MAAAALAASGCTPSPDEDRRAEAIDALRGHVASTARLSGFTLTDDWRLEVVSGQPPSTQALYPTEGSGTTDPAAPIAVPRDDFPLDATVELAQAQIESCDGDARVTARALAAGTAVVSAECDGQGSAFLDGDPLQPIAEPVSAAAVTQVWADIERAGIAEDVVFVDVDASQGIVNVALRGTDRERTYHWYRALDGTHTRVESHPLLTGVTLPGPGPLPDAPTVAAAVDELLASLPDPGQAARLEVRRDTGQVVALKAADGTDLASATLD
ncbi:hypothetical protein GCM10025789_08610 [Tessaracoccus lubricantis]|uniref:Uncharacterized protein n=1 Tax=Tessaracoccus lubricantis TaxID=545543 RepID=A0ABP9F6B9_9ACTN